MIKNVFAWLRRWPGFPIMVVTVILVIVNSVFTEYFLSLSVMEGFLATYAPLVLCTLGQTIVLMSGGIDLSISGVVSLANVTMIVLVGAGWDFFEVGPAGGLYNCQSMGGCGNGWPIWAAAMGGIFSSVLIGVINGFTVAVLRIRPLPATLATMFIATGAALFVLPLPGGQLPYETVVWYQQSFLSAPKGAWVILLAMLAWLILMATPYGIQLRAAGRDTFKAYASGVPVVWTRFFSYVAGSFFAGAGGVALTLTITAGDPTVGNPFTLNTIAAAVLGGVALSGGFGGVGGPVFGALFLGLVVNTILSLQVPHWYQWLVSGVIILLGLVGTVVMKKTRLAAEE